jgi:hypothetical protein
LIIIALYCIIFYLALLKERQSTYDWLTRLPCLSSLSRLAHQNPHQNDLQDMQFNQNYHSQYAHLPDQNHPASQV